MTGGGGVAGRRRPYRIVFHEDHPDGAVRRGTVSVEDWETARHEAQAIARDGKRVEVHYVTDAGQRRRLESFWPPEPTAPTTPNERYSRSTRVARDSPSEAPG